MENALGDKIKKLRKDQKLTLDQLADLAGASKSYIWELENKNPPRPSAEKLSRIAEQLGTTIEFLLDTENKIKEEDAADAKFYRKYRNMDEPTKSKIRKMVSLWEDDE
ncbi:helix-turn-helix domain-containing protein [Thalassospira lucentensis]|uniref:helix-turn-helix domain-containing protein n=1 Tax=Thalassospira lucentensis TaxID=168935 RepID=UPI00399D576E